MIRRFLDVSSGHLAPATWTWLDEVFADDALRDPKSRWSSQLGGGRTRYGWFVYAPEGEIDDCPTELVTIFKIARKHDAEYVLFDCDAEPDHDIPVLHPEFLDD